MIFLLAIAFLGISTLFINSLFRHPSRLAHLLGLLILPYASLVLISEIASILQKINIPFFLLAHFSLAIIAGLVWVAAGKPSLLGAFDKGKWAFWRELPPFQSHPALYILAIGVVFIYLFGAGMILILPQNNYDSMTYHLSRVGYWLQHQTLSPWLTPNPRQTTSPINAELGLMWTVLFWGTDQLTGFVQWFSAIGIALAIYGLSRLMGADRSQGIFAVLVWATFPQIVLQSTTTQNDLVVAFFLLSTLYFLFTGIDSQQRGELILSGISLGLAFGTKATIFIVMPGFALVVILIWFLRRKFGFRYLTHWGVASLIGIGLLGSFNYLQNQIFYRDPFSIPEWTSYVTSPDLNTSRFATGTTNLFLYLSDFIDFTGIPEIISSALGQMKADFLEWLFLDLKMQFKFNQAYSLSTILLPPIHIHEDTSWFGPLSFLFIIPGTIHQFWRGIKLRDSVRLGLIFIGIGFCITQSYLMAWTPYRVRYFVLAVSVLSPFLAFTYKPSRKWKWIYWLAIALGLWVMVATVLQNFSKPLVGTKVVWGKTPSEIRMANNLKMKPVFIMVEENVPKDAILATRLGVDHWDYLFFGKEFERRIVQLDPSTPGIDREYLRASEADYVLLAPRERPFLEVPKYLEWIDEEDGWLLFTVSFQEETPTPPEDIIKQVQGLTDDKGLLSIDEDLAYIVGLTELYAFDWDVETVDGNGFKWLGEGLNQGLQGFLWAQVELPVKIAFDLQPGPSRGDTIRNLQISYHHYGPYGSVLEGRIVEEIQITNQVRTEIIVPLHKGLNEFRIMGLDRATIPILPNGDARPLLVLLDRIEVLPLENKQKIFKVDESLNAKIKVTEQYLAEWGLEGNNGQYFQWLGEGLEQGFRGYIWAEADFPVRLVLNVEPGPSRDDFNRNLSVSVFQYGYSESGYQVNEVAEFAEPSDIEMVVHLNNGLNVVQLQVMDEATIKILPNGDTRPLLVKLNRIDVKPINE